MDVGNLVCTAIKGFQATQSLLDEKNNSLFFNVFSSDDKKKDELYSVDQTRKDNKTVKILEIQSDLEKAQALYQKTLEAQKATTGKFNQDKTITGDITWDINRQVFDYFGRLRDSRRKKQTELFNKVDELTSLCKSTNNQRYMHQQQLHYIKGVLGNNGEINLLDSHKLLSSKKNRFEKQQPKLLEEAQESKNAFKALEADYSNKIKLMIEEKDQQKKAQHEKELATFVEEKLKPAYQKHLFSQTTLTNCTLNIEAINGVESILRNKIFNAPPDLVKTRTIEALDHIKFQILKQEQAFIKYESALEKTHAHVDALSKEFNEAFNQETLVSEKIKTGKPLNETEVKLVEPFLKKAFEERVDPFKKQLKAYNDAIELVKNGKINELRVDINKPKNKWPANFMIAAGTGQRQYGFGSFYLDGILNNLNRCKSLPSAILKTEQEDSIIHRTEKNGKREDNSYQVPVSSTRVLEAWNIVKNDKNPPPRKVLYIEGHHKNDQEEDSAQKTYKRFEASIRAHYGKTVEIVRLKQPSLKELEDAMEGMAKVSNKDTEIMIVLKGHGGSSLEEGLTEDDRLKEGSMQGSFWLKQEGPKDKQIDLYLEETTMKKLCAKFSHCKSGLLLADCCHAGAWLAKADKKKTDHQVFYG